MSALDKWCPVCGEPPNLKCRTLTTGRSTDTHLARFTGQVVGIGSWPGRAMSERGNYLHVTDQTRLSDAVTPLFCYLPDVVGIVQVGSSLEHKDFRDVDVRAILADADYVSLPRGVRKLLNITVSVYLQQTTGLPVDFQIQHMFSANDKYGDRPRSALGHRNAYDEGEVYR